MENLNKLLNFQQDICNLQYTINLLKWELKVSAPKKSEQNLIELITYYERKLFELQTSPYYGQLLKDVISDKEFSSIDDAEQRYITSMLRRYEENKRVPADFYAKYTEFKNKSTVVWREAKANNNYALFKPYLKQIIEMTKQYYSYLNGSSNDLYNVMLDHYEIGMTSDVIDKLFDQLKVNIKPMIPKGEKKLDVPNRVEYTDQELIDCASTLLDYIGFDMDKGRLGIYPHGYTERMCENDIRIAFRHTNDPYDFVTTIIHEGGHGIYEQNISSNLAKYGNKSVENLYALHESQSRFYENILGRNINFWIPIYDDIKKKLHLDISLEEFIRILNNPVPILKRTESDELTYCMHIILRYEIERAIFSNEVEVDDLPDMWNEKMDKYLGIVPKKDSEGLMQDVHWAEGDFGYFPSYLLGSIYDGMFIDAIEKDIGSIDDLLKTGKIKNITSYLNDKIHKNGGAYTSKEIINKMCHKEISAEPLSDYFVKKYIKKI